MPAFLPEPGLLIGFALATLMLAITPGPDMALQLSRAVNHGFRHGLASAAGAMSGIAVHTSLAALGISVLIVAAPAAFFLLKLAGAVYLLWLALQAVLHGGGLRLAAAGKRPPTLSQSYLAGVAVNLLNPKVVLFFVTFLPQFVDPQDPAVTAKLFFLGAEFILLSIPPAVLTVYFAKWLAQAFSRTNWVEKALNWSFAGVFTAFAVVILSAEARH